MRLTCPVCHGEGCSFCLTFRAELNRNIPDLIPPDIRRDPRHAFEIMRYEAIEKAGPEEYAGYGPTRPRRRAKIMADLLRENDVKEFVNIGPGFGFLEEEMRGGLALDHCRGFLDIVRRNARCIQAVAERLPLASAPCVVCDSTFQTLVDREAFLCEAARVCELLIFTIGFRANYPRKPQGGFNVLRSDERRTLYHYLGELGFGIEVRFLHLESLRWVDAMDDADYMYVTGKK